jgi:hypothetical protein
MLASALTGLQIPSEVLLLSESSPTSFVNPNLFRSALVHVPSAGNLWFDAAQLAETSGGLRPIAGMESALPLRPSGAEWLSPLATRQGVRLEQGGIEARLEAAISEAGLLVATATINARGASARFLEGSER